MCVWRVRVRVHLRVHVRRRVHVSVRVRVHLRDVCAQRGDRGGERWREVERAYMCVICVYLCVSTGTQMHNHRMAHCGTLVLLEGVAN